LLTTIASSRRLLVVLAVMFPTMLASRQSFGTCTPQSPPPSITICSPAPGTSSSDPVQFSAAGASNSPITSFRIYVNNLLRYSVASGTVNTALTLPGGSNFIVLQFYSNGTWTKASEQITVTGSTAGQVPVTTYHNDLHRTGANNRETTLNPSNVNSSSFGKKYAFPVDGQVYAQPLYLPNLSISGVQHNVVFVATENDTVYAFDADGRSSQPLWKVHFGTPATGQDVEGISPIIGVTSTPVIDVATGTLYVVSRTVESNARIVRLHALDIATGAEKFGGSKIVTAKVSGTGRDSVNGVITLESNCYQRTGLAINGSNIYFGFGHCAHGWMLAYDKSTLAQTAIFNSTPNGAGGMFWNSGGAPAVDGSGNLYTISAVDTGDPASGYNDSFLKFSSALKVQDFFMPSNEAYLRQNDADLGSGDVVIVPNNSSSHPYELIGGGKDGRIFVLNRASMGKFNSTTDQVLQAVQTGTQQFDNIFSTPGFWNGHLYIHCENDVLKSYGWSDTTGLLTSTYTSKGNHVFGVHGATVSISSNGNADGIVWEIESTKQPSGGPAILHAYDALNVASELYNSSQVASRDTAGKAVKFTVPTIADGKVFVGTANELDVYGLL
jgi:PQQ-like domain